MDVNRLLRGMGQFADYVLGVTAFTRHVTGTASATGDLTYDNLAVSTFIVGEVITGGTSAATAKIAAIISVTKVQLSDIVGTFQNDEEITGGTSTATADVVGIVLFSVPGNFYLLQADGAANVVLSKVIQKNGTIISDDLTILAGAELKGDFINIYITSGTVYAYTKPAFPKN